MRAFAITLLALVAAHIGYAQTGSITGKVVDIAGNPVSGAAVEVRQNAGGRAVSSRSSADGTYTLSGLPAGKWELTGTAPGFEPFAKSAIAITNNTVTVDIRLLDFQLNALGDGREFFASRAAGRKKVTGPTPRLANGKPDLSGIWYGQADVDGGKPVLTPWAAAIKKERDANEGRDFPQSYCLPMGILLDSGLSMWQVVQTPTVLVLISEVDNPGHRVIYLDGRPRPKDYGPTWYGRAIGYWEGDTLVVDSTGFNDKTWLPDSQAHSDKLHVVERYRRPDLGRLEIEFTLEDPDAFKEPWVIKRTADLAPDEQTMEYICNENEKDRNHLTAK